MLLGWALIQSDRRPSKKKSEHRGDTGIKTQRRDYMKAKGKDNHLQTIC